MLVFNKRKNTELMLACVLVVGMIFLAPTITQTAVGHTAAHVITTDVGLDNMWKNPVKGQFTKDPPNQISPHNTYKEGDIKWMTEPMHLGADEQATVQYDVKDTDGKNLGTVAFRFSNPEIGQNTCSVTTDQPEKIHGYCSIDFLPAAAAWFCVWSTSPIKGDCDYD